MSEPRAAEPRAGPTAVDLGHLGLDRGGHLLLKRALAGVAVGERLAVRGRDPHLALHLAVWCRAQGHEFAPAVEADPADLVGHVTRRTDQAGRWRGAERAGDARAAGDAVASHPSARWGLAARGATVEAGGPAFDFPLGDRRTVWADEAARLYEQAAAAQWDPATAIAWSEPFVLADEVEDAVVQVMTYLVENETAALLVPARFLAQLHPHFREVMQLLAVQTADEARHIEVFTRRALLRRDQLGLSTVGGQLSLKTLVDEPDFALASFLLSVLGEGSFLSLLWFLHRNAPDPVTAEVARLAAQDEARHVAFGLAHLCRHAGEEPALRARLAAAVERRHDALRHTAGLNEEVFDALVLLAAGSWQPEAIERGHAAVVDLTRDMDEGRRRRLRRLGFTDGEAEALSSLHTRNFM
ncbi:MAG TPA: sulfurtransferase TusA family protein [Kofleriaceae bacterium]|nr:sulfurtransferase TusA family protein [Kofleriaceae bacterium]